MTLEEEEDATPANSQETVNTVTTVSNVDPVSILLGVAVGAAVEMRRETTKGCCHGTRSNREASQVQVPDM